MIEPRHARRADGTPATIAGDARWIMGILNLTPDSFSDPDPDAMDATPRRIAALTARAQAMVAAGADCLDLGAEATNPRATAIDADTEWRRLAPGLAACAGLPAVISVDTTKAAVAARALAAGAHMINDISGGRFDPDLPRVVAAHDAVYVLGHLRGDHLAAVFTAEVPTTWTEVRDDLCARLETLPVGLRDRTLVDPGLGFGKGADPTTNLTLIRHAGDLARATGCPVVIGASRKRFVRALAPATADPDAIDDLSTGISLAAWQAGAAMVRVHAVARVARLRTGWAAVISSP